ncbi:hypothetical protein B0H13DRAFT_1905727 [Mycena leptocephala]|nr:hypothetical protein B0H13DRAFT_1905727 [Mycena leptocephala]
MTVFEDEGYTRTGGLWAAEDDKNPRGENEVYCSGVQEDYGVRWRKGGWRGEETPNRGNFVRHRALVRIIGVAETEDVVANHEISAHPDLDPTTSRTTSLFLSPHLNPIFLPTSVNTFCLTSSLKSFKLLVLLIQTTSQTLLRSCLPSFSFSFSLSQVLHDDLHLNIPGAQYSIPSQRRPLDAASHLGQYGALLLCWCQFGDMHTESTRLLGDNDGPYITCASVLLMSPDHGRICKPANRISCVGNPGRHLADYLADSPRHILLSIAKILGASAQMISAGQNLQDGLQTTSWGTPWPFAGLAHQLGLPDNYWQDLMYQERVELNLERQWVMGGRSKGRSTGSEMYAGTCVQQRRRLLKMDAGDDGGHEERRGTRERERERVKTVKLATFYSNWYTGKNGVEKGPKWSRTRGYRAKQMRIKLKQSGKVGENIRKRKSPGAANWLDQQTDPMMHFGDQRRVLFINSTTLKSAHDLNIFEGEVKEAVCVGKPRSAVWTDVAPSGQQLESMPSSSFLEFNRDGKGFMQKLN